MYVIRHNPSLGITEVIFRGLTTGKDLREATTKCISLEKQTDSKRFLVDAAKATIAASIVDICSLPAIISSG